MRPLFPALFAGLCAFAALPAAADAVKDGETVYKTKTCMACHGLRGQKAILSYPALAGQTERYLLTQLQDIKSGKRVGSVDPATGHPFVQGMADIMHLLSDDDMKNVVKYLTAQEPGAPKPLDPAPSAEDLAAGEKAYRSLGCTACHGKEGLRPATKTYPAIAGLNRDYLVRQMTEIRDKVRVNGQSKLMFGTISKAKDDDIAAIATWLSQIDRSAK